MLVDYFWYSIPKNTGVSTYTGFTQAMFVLQSIQECQGSIIQKIPECAAILFLQYSGHCFDAVQYLSVFRHERHFLVKSCTSLMPSLISCFSTILVLSIAVQLLWQPSFLAFLNFNEWWKVVFV